MIIGDRALGSADHPLQERVLRIGVIVVLKNTLDRCSDGKRLVGIADEVADNAHTIGLRKLHQYHDVGSLCSESGMHGMPDPLMAVQHSNSRNFIEAEIERIAAVAALTAGFLQAA